MKLVLGTMAAAALLMAGCENMHHNNAPNRMTGPDHAGSMDHKGMDHKGMDHMGRGSGNVSMADHEFIKAAASGGLYEVRSSELALQKARRDDVKSLAQTIIDDHTKANNELKGFAQKNGLTLSDAMNHNHQGMYDRLSKLDGMAFDQEYLRQQTTAHREAITIFDNTAKRGSSAELKQWAQSTLPTLQHHLEMVQAKIAPQTPQERGNPSNPEMK